MKDIWQSILSNLYRLERLDQTKISVGTPCSIELYDTYRTSATISQCFNNKSDF